MRMPAAPGKTPKLVTAGQALQGWRSTHFGGQREFATAIRVSVRQVAAAERGEHIGRPTKSRIEDGLGWRRGDWDRFVDTGEHPPVNPPDRTTAAVPEVVRMTSRQLVVTTSVIEEVQGPEEARRFYVGALKVREEWTKSGNSASTREDRDQAG